MTPNTQHTMEERLTPEILERFWKKVKKTKACWLWIAARDSDGYGNWSHSKKMVKPHRFSYELHVEKIPEGLVIDHICRVRNCVNPNHLRVVTNKTNMFLGEGLAVKNRLKTHCPQGHQYSGKNLYLYKGTRGCISCARERNKKNPQYQRNYKLRLKKKNE